MSVEPYSKAQRVFVIIDNGSAHRGKKSIKQLQGRYKNLIPVHTPVHASWLKPSRDLLLDRPTQGADPQRLPRPRHARTTTARVRPPLRADRHPVPMEVHPGRPRPPRPTTRSTRRPSRLTTNTSAKVRARALSTASPAVPSALCWKRASALEMQAEHRLRWLGRESWAQRLR